MSWQDELRRLDAALAGGGISAEQYRRARDELLATAASSNSMAATAPVQHGKPPNATPSAPRQEAQQPSVLQQYSPPGLFNRIQERRPQFPVMGSEIFAEAKPARSHQPVLVVLLVVALVAGGASVWWFGFRDGTMATADTSTQPSRPDVENLLPQLPGEPNNRNGTVSLDRGVASGLFAQDVADYLRRNGVSEIIIRGSQQNGFSYEVLVAPAQTGAMAEQTAKDMQDHQAKAGMKPVQADGVPSAVTVLKLLTPDFNLYRAVWAAGSMTVHVGVTQIPPKDEADLAKELERTVTSVLQALPPG